jgi:hypothetical protein
VVCGTNHPGPLVRASLSSLSAVADQIVVGADERVPHADIVEYAAVADVMVTYPFTGPNQARRWLADRCQTDWILFLDGDETPSAQLLERLPDLIRDRLIAGYWFPRRWAYPDANRYLAEQPWSPDHQLRLVRNDDRLWFPALKHTGAVTTGPTKREDAPILHLDLLLNDVAARRRKVALYESQSFGHMTLGTPTNAAVYLPEQRPDAATAALPPEDATMVGRALAATPSGRRWRRTPISARATVDDIRRTLPWERFADDDARATIAVVGPVESSPPANARFVVPVEVTNHGRRTWPRGWDSPIKISYHWRRDGVDIVTDGERTALPHPLRPGDSANLDMLVECPPVAGAMELVPDVVAEGDRWFGLTSSIPFEITASAHDVIRGRDVVPVAELLELRRRLVLPDELERQLSESDPDVVLPSDVAAALAGLPIGGWALDAAVLALLIDTHERLRPELTLEFGSGTSTVLLAWLARRAGMEGVCVLSIEQDPAEAERVTAELDRRGLGDHVRLVVAPLLETEVDGLRLWSYDEAIVGRELTERQPSLIVIDGPSRASGGNRLPGLRCAQRYLRSPARFILDDAWRDVELAVAEHWSRIEGIDIDGVVPVGKGALIGTVSPTNRHTADS